MTTFNGTAGNDNITAAATDDLINGLAGQDILYGLGGNDTLDGGTGRDTMYGGAGDDFYYVDDVDDAVRENVDDGAYDVILSTVSYSQYTQHGANVEELYLLGTADLSASGDDKANMLGGNTGSNVLSGGAGDDVLLGFGDVHETYDIALPVAYGAVDGDDTLDGGTGRDIMAGGAGNDTYYVDQANDSVIEVANEGTDDVIIASASYALNAGHGYFIESVYLVGNANLNLTGDVRANYLVGNTGSNVLTGGGGNDSLLGFGDVTEERPDVTLPLSYGLADGADTLDGGTGADWMAGGDGDDVYYVDQAADQVLEFNGQGNDVIISSSDYGVAFARGRYVESIYLSGTANLNLTGDALANRLYGNTGANVLTGGDGNDLLVGFANVTAARGLDSHGAYGSVDGNDTLDGGAGNDTLDGGAGNDSMTGGTGSDYYIVDSASDIVQESDTVNGGAWDVVESSVDFDLTLAATAGVEGLTLTGGAVLGKGNSLSNGISGTDQDNLLYGYDGNDTVYGFGGTDYIYGGNGDDVIYGDDGDDFLSGAAGNDMIEGGAGADTLFGGAGNDTYSVYSGFGVDTITNGASSPSTEVDTLYLQEASYNQLWFSQVGNDLQIAQVNTSDKVVVQNWFTGAANQLDAIYAMADGKQLDASKVAGLVSAMAGFAPQDMSSGAPAGLLAARDAAWHGITA